MYSLFTSAVFAYLAANSFTTANPVGRAASSASETSSAPAPTGAGSEGTDFEFALSNGFPNLTADALKAIQEAAHGTLPNGPPPASIAADDLTSLRLIAFNEIWEVAFFTELLYNVTNNVTGYHVTDSAERTQIIAAIAAVQAQEQLHALMANGVLTHFNAGAIEPCRYTAPVANLTDALTLAYTFTDVVLGTLANVQTHLAENGDSALIASVGSIIGQEGEQNGFYRYQVGLIPSALPFLTAASRAFAFSALNQNFVVPNSCPNSKTIDLPIFEPLTVVTQNIKPVDQELTFSFPKPSSSKSGNYSLVYINQQNTPVVQPLNSSSLSSSNGKITFNARLPYTKYEMNGLTIAAVVNSPGPFNSTDAVANHTIAGPGLIEIQ